MWEKFKLIQQRKRVSYSLLYKLFFLICTTSIVDHRFHIDLVKLCQRSRDFVYMLSGARIMMLKSLFVYSENYIIVIYLVLMLNTELRC